MILKSKLGNQQCLPRGKREIDKKNFDTLVREKEFWGIEFDAKRVKILEDSLLDKMQ